VRVVRVVAVDECEIRITTSERVQMMNFSVQIL